MGVQRVRVDQETDAGSIAATIIVVLGTVDARVAVFIGYESDEQH